MSGMVETDGLALTQDEFTLIEAQLARPGSNLGVRAGKNRVVSRAGVTTARF